MNSNARLNCEPILPQPAACNSAGNGVWDEITQGAETMLNEALPVEYHANYIAVELLASIGVTWPSQAQIDEIEQWVERCIRATGTEEICNEITQALRGMS